MVFARSLAPTLQSKLSGRFLRITVQEYGKLAIYFRHENCGGNHAANRKQCPRFPKNKAQNHQNIAPARNNPENNRKFSDKDFLKIINPGQNIIIAGDLNAAHRVWNNARSNAFDYALRKIVDNKPNVRIVAPHTPAHINSSSRLGARDSIIDPAVLKISTSIMVLEL
ncbi:hypothetical protein TNCV_5052281 [Trichonephila clavipes]|nr:hypothetical protein TNCV_5052281 [Trichonephila clavipes]